MGRIIFLNPFAADQISGGIKTVFLHAELLWQQDYKVFINSPQGVPNWLEKDRFEHLILPVDEAGNFSVTNEDVLIFPEILRERMAELLKTPLPCKKVIFCQNHYYLYSIGYTSAYLKHCGIEKIITVSETAKKGIESLLGKEIDIDIIPPFVNEHVFTPVNRKQLKILVSDRKWKEHGYGGYIQRIFWQKYPDFPKIPWMSLENMTESEAAKSMQESSILLFLGRMESLPLTPLEAMACGCGIVGFYGNGGYDYARHKENGFWHSPEDIIGVVESLYILLNAFWKEDLEILKIVANGQKTAKDFYSQNLKEIVCKNYINLFN